MSKWYSKKPLSVRGGDIPLTLRALPQWVVWRAEPNPKKDGKVDKVPYMGRNPEHRASSTDPSTWCTFEEAMDAYEVGDADGVGFVLTDSDALVGIDLDDVSEEDARDILHLVPSYAELSPSGNGIRVIVRGEKAGSRCRRGGVEVYDRFRFLTITGHRLEGAPAEVQDVDLKPFYRHVFGSTERSADAPSQTLHAPRRMHAPDDDALLDRARTARNGRLFVRLFDSGDWKDAGYPSQSEADAALCSMLGFWTRCNADQMDRLFRRSRLMRDKWDERRGERTYGEITIANAISACTDEYTPMGKAKELVSEKGNEGFLEMRIGDAKPNLRVESAREPVGSTNALVIRVADVERECIRWLWPGRLALGKMTVLDGDPGLGKSTLYCDLAARITTGRALPDAPDTLPREPGAVVIVTCEDNVADTIRPRLEEARADLTRVHVIQSVRDGDTIRTPVLPGDADTIEDVVRRTGAVLLVIDPLMAHLGERINSHRDSDARQALTPLALLAERCDCAVLVVRHLNKMQGGDPLYRGGGSIGIIGQARFGLLLGSHPEHDRGEGVRVLAQTKANVGSLSTSLMLRLVPSDNDQDTAVIRWEGPTRLNAADLLVYPKAERPRKKAVNWLRERLTGVEPVPASTIFEEAKALGLSRRTVYRAKAALDVDSVQEPNRPGGRWYWNLPKEPSEVTDCQSQKSGNLGDECAELVDTNGEIGPKNGVSSTGRQIATSRLPNEGGYLRVEGPELVDTNGEIGPKNGVSSTGRQIATSRLPNEGGYLASVKKYDISPETVRPLRKDNHVDRQDVLYSGGQ